MGILFFATKAVKGGQRQQKSHYQYFPRSTSLDSATGERRRRRQINGELACSLGGGGKKT